MLLISESNRQEEENLFDRVPDALLLIIFNKLSEIKTLTRCRAVSKRFNSLIPQVEDLLVKVDCVISSESGEWFLLYLLKSIFQSLQYLISPKKASLLTRNRNSPAEILRGFDKIKRLEIELPAGDLQLEKGTVLRWKAAFGRTLKSCVILVVQKIEDAGEIDVGDEDEIDFRGDRGAGLKLRVVWTISALIAASARHFLLREVIREHKGIESLVLRDREGEGTVVMDKQGLKEFRESEHEEEESSGEWKNRTMVPAVRMRMMHEPRLELCGGVRMKSATLVVVRPTEGMEMMNKVDAVESVEDCDLGTFGGVFGEAVEALLEKPSYLLEMNSF